MKQNFSVGLLLFILSPFLRCYFSMIGHLDKADLAVSYKCLSRFSVIMIALVEEAASNVVMHM